MPPVVLALPGHAPCTEAEYLVRPPRGAEARSPAIRAAAACADAACDATGQPGKAKDRPYCDGDVCQWVLPAPPNPLEVVGDPNWDVTGSFATGSVVWNAQGFPSRASMKVRRA